MSQYAVVQYYPTVESGELMNVAIVIWDNEKTVWRLRKDFDAVKVFAGKNWSNFMLKVLESWTTTPISEHLKINSRGSLAVAMSCLKMTEPRGTLGDPCEDELASLARIFFRE